MNRFTRLLLRLKPRRKSGIQKLAEAEKRLRETSQKTEEAVAGLNLDPSQPAPSGTLAVRLMWGTKENPRDPRVLTEGVPGPYVNDSITHFMKKGWPLPQPGKRCPLSGRQVLTEKGRAQRMKSSYSAKDWSIYCPLCGSTYVYITKQGIMLEHKAPAR